MTWSPHVVGCECAYCALAAEPPPISPTQDAWSNDPDRTTRRGDTQ